MQDGTEKNFRHLAAAALLQAVCDSRSPDPATRAEAAGWLATVGQGWADLLDIRLDLARLPDDVALAGKRGLWKLTRGS